AFDRLGLSPVGADAPIELLRAIERASQHPEESQEFSCQLGEGPAARDLRGSIGPLPTESGDDELFLLTLIDRTQEMMAERNLRRELVSDSLTGLPNRAGFEELVEQRGRTDGPGGDHAILLLDLARFSRINEHIGPLAGDVLIITVARRLKSSLRGGDRLARSGGDEFAIYARIAGGKGDAREIARRIRGCFDHPLRIGDLKVSVDCALGCAIQGTGESDIADQIRHAQIALKRAKQTDRIEIYEPEAAIVSDNRFGLE